MSQVAIYSVYECLLKEFTRYDDRTLAPLGRLKTANRKSGTVGDVDVLRDGRTVEAVEIKFGMSVESRHVSDAIEKIKAADVRRYYILATEGIKKGDERRSRSKLVRSIAPMAVKSSSMASSKPFATTSVL